VVFFCTSMAVGGRNLNSGGSGGGGLAGLRNLQAVGETCETVCETYYGETLRFKHEPCWDLGRRARPGVRRLLRQMETESPFPEHSAVQEASINCCVLRDCSLASCGASSVWNIFHAFRLRPGSLDITVSISRTGAGQVRLVPTNRNGAVWNPRSRSSMQGASHSLSQPRCSMLRYL